jgi:hypothetical protein
LVFSRRDADASVSDQPEIKQLIDRLSPKNPATAGFFFAIKINSNNQQTMRVDGCGGRLLLTIIPGARARLCDGGVETAIKKRIVRDALFSLDA